MGTYPCDSDIHLGERAAFVESHVGVTGFQLEGFLRDCTQGPLIS